MLRRRRDAALPAPRGRYGQPGPRRSRPSPRPTRRPLPGPPRRPHCCPRRCPHRDPPRRRSLSVFGTLDILVRGSGPLRALLAGHVGAGPFWGGGGEGRGQGTGRTPEWTERGPAESRHGGQRPGMDGRGAGQGLDAGRGMSAGVGREGAEQDAPLRPSGIQLKPEDWPVGEDGGMRGQTMVTSEAQSFLPKQRRA